MSTLVCRVCLAGNRRMNIVENNELQLIFQKLISTELDPGLSGLQPLCYICYRQLQRCRTFSDMGHRSADILRDIYEKGLEATQETITMLKIDSSEHLSVSTVKTMSIDATDSSTETPAKEVRVAVKLEPTVDDEIVKCEGTSAVDIETEEQLKDTKPLKLEGSFASKKTEIFRKTKLLRPNKHAIREKPYACAKCNLSFSFKHNLQKHLSNHTRGKSLERNECTTFSQNMYFHKRLSGDNLACGLCNKTFCNKYVLLKHRRTHTGKKPFKCRMCVKAFNANSSLLKHMKIHDGERFACDKCNKTFSQKNALDLHNVENCGENSQVELRIFACTACNKIFTLHSTLKRHMRSHRKPYTCNKCSKTFSTNKNLQNHMTEHTEEIQYACNQCSKTFNRDKNLKIHMKIHTEGKPCVCDKCNKSFSLPIYLQKHMLTHSAVKPYVCTQCDKAYAVKNSLHNHMKKHTAKKTYTHTCDRCAKVFTDNSNLQKHLLIHTGEKPYSCEQCDKAFLRKFQLQEHMRVHTGEKPYACNECGKTFTQSSSLSLHKKTHSGLRPFICDVCEKTFIDKYGLQSHMRSHTGEKPYACDSCQQTFAYNSSLHDHVRRFHNGDKVSCDRCCKSFSRNSHLKRHMKIHIREKQSFISL